MLSLSSEKALDKRIELVEQGYTMIPGVMGAELLEELRAWSNDVFLRVRVDAKYRYQGSDIHVYTQQHWAEMDMQQDERSFPDPIVSRVLEQPAQTEVCRLIGLEGLRCSGKMIVLSKPGHGPPLYWHQDFMNWNSPAAATGLQDRLLIAYFQGGDQQIQTLRLDASSFFDLSEPLVDTSEQTIVLPGPLDVAVDPLTGRIYVAAFGTQQSPDGSLWMLDPLEAPVPEPGTFAMFAAGAVLWARRWNPSAHYQHMRKP